MKPAADASPFGSCIAEVPPSVLAGQLDLWRKPWARVQAKKGMPGSMASCPPLRARLRLLRGLDPPLAADRYRPFPSASPAGKEARGAPPAAFRP
ncbi:MAG: hypothetical protein R2762_06650 [Bryobacteraceae bacterium]